MILKNASFSLFVFLCLACNSPKYLTKEWSIVQVQEWYNQKHSAWDGILYRGSDKKMHHFVSRVRDEWHFFNVKKSALTLADERPILKDTGVVGYYFVDPNKEFAKIKDY